MPPEPRNAGLHRTPFERGRPAPQRPLEAQDELEEVRRNANRAKDGRNVYRAADGNIYDEDGALVGHDEIDWSMWDEDRSRLDQFTAARDLYRQRQESREDILERKRQLSEGDLANEQLDEIEADWRNTTPL